MRGKTHDLARIFLRLRLRRRTRFFLHLALIFVGLVVMARLVTAFPGLRTFLKKGGDSQFCEDEERWLKKDKCEAIPRRICVVGSLLS